MNENDEDRACAAECLHMAKSVQNEDEKQSWLALTDSWLLTFQLRQVTARGIYSDAPVRRELHQDTRTEHAARWGQRYVAALALGTCFLIGLWAVIRSHYVG
jgi:hypothetical protein